MTYPKLARIRQKFNTEKVADIHEAIFRELGKLALQEKLAGKRIAVTAGSRGVANFAELIRSVCDYVKDQGGNPFVVPSMGSHGGATAEGQIAVLASYGITEESMGCPIISSMDVVCLGKTETGAPVYFDRTAYESDGIIVINRVKPHTDFVGKNESGIVKMISVGLGKEKGCTAMHRYGLAKTIPQSFSISVKKAPIIAGIAVVENSRDETFLIEGVLLEQFLQKDSELLEIARHQVPQLPVKELDILVVKEIGKEFSGTCMDTKVIGRIRIAGIEEPEYPKINKIVSLRLSDHSYGNALGIGLADITTTQLVKKIDFPMMHANILPSTYLERGKIPLFFESEKLAIDTAANCLGNVEPNDIKMAIIENTLELGTLLVTENILDQLGDLEILEQGIELCFDEKDSLTV